MTDTADLRAKYQDTLDRLERGEARWQRVEELFRRALSRLSIAAGGIDPRLDDELDRLRDTIRGEVDEGRLHTLVERLTTTLGQVEEEQQQREAEPRQALAELLTKLPLSGKMRRRADQLRERLIAGGGDLAQYEDQCAALIGEALGQGGGGQSRGRLGRLLDRGERSAGEAGDGDHSSTAEGDSVAPVLLRLLEKLSVPPELSEQEKRLRARLVGGEELAEWQRVVDELAALIAAMASKSQREKRELEGFVYQMVDRLQELDAHLQGAEKLRHESKRSGEQLNAEMQAQVRDMHSSAESASDLEQLKSDVRRRMEAIGQRMDAYRRSENERHAQSEQRIHKMQERLKSLESESTELRQRVQQEHHRALHDPLTGLANRLAFDERCEQEMARRRRYSTPLSLMVLDVDFFKRVNDTYGHKAGDLVLKTIAQLLKHHLRDTDFLARFGGEEFIALLPETELQGALQVAEKLRTEVASCGFHYQNQAVPITISIGVTEFREDDGFEAVFERADAALYRAKNEGRNRSLTA